jgi:hypothetical protein
MRFALVNEARFQTVMSARELPIATLTVPFRLFSLYAFVMKRQIRSTKTFSGSDSTQRLSQLAQRG